MLAEILIELNTYDKVTLLNLIKNINTHVIITLTLRKITLFRNFIMYSCFLFCFYFRHFEQIVFR